MTDQEIETLRAKLMLWQGESHPHGYIHADALRAITALHLEKERYREALGWYAIQAAGCRKLGQHGEIYRNNLDRDGGAKARAVLAELKKEEGEA